MNLALASLPSPHKTKRPRTPDEVARECTFWRTRHGERTCVQTRRERHTKWANFGGYVVDLGPLPAARRVADNRPAAHGMALAEMYERLWFALFDPALHEATPPVPACFTPAAVRAGPIRCGSACPATLWERAAASESEVAADAARRAPTLRAQRRAAREAAASRAAATDPALIEGCALSDTRGLTAAAERWRYAPGRSRCLVSGCLAAHDAPLAESSGGGGDGVGGARTAGTSGKPAGVVAATLATDRCPASPECETASHRAMWRPMLRRCGAGSSSDES